MKKFLTLFMACMIVFGMTSCAAEEASTTVPNNDTPPATTTSPTTTTNSTSPIPLPGTTDEKPDTPADWTLLPEQTDWHYQIFYCPFNANAAVKYDPATDDMVKWMTEKGEEWYKDEAVLAEMKSWPTHTAPMGDRYDALGDGNSPIGWSGDKHGLICYQTVTLTAEQAEWLTYCEEYSIYMNIFYDNCIYVYINGTLAFSNDANGGEGDWNNAMEPVDFHVDASKLFHEGENDIVVTMKDGWGAREFIMAIECMY